MSPLIFCNEIESSIRNCHVKMNFEVGKAIISDLLVIFEAILKGMSVIHLEVNFHLRVTFQNRPTKGNET